MDFIGDTSGIIGLLKMFAIGAFFGLVFRGFLTISKWKTKRKQLKREERIKGTD